MIAAVVVVKVRVVVAVAVVVFVVVMVGRREAVLPVIISFQPISSRDGCNVR